MHVLSQTSSSITTEFSKLTSRLIAIVKHAIIYSVFIKLSHS